MTEVKLILKGLLNKYVTTLKLKDIRVQLSN